MARVSNAMLEPMQKTELEGLKLWRCAKMPRLGVLGGWIRPFMS